MAFVPDEEEKRPFNLLYCEEPTEEKTQVYRMKSKSNGPVLLKWLFYRTESINNVSS